MLSFVGCNEEKIITLPDSATPKLIKFENGKLGCYEENTAGKNIEVDPRICDKTMAFQQGQVFRIYERLKTCPEVKTFEKEVRLLNQ